MPADRAHVHHPYAQAFAPTSAADPTQLPSLGPAPRLPQTGAHLAAQAWTVPSGVEFEQQPVQEVYKIRPKKSRPLNRNQACRTCRGRKVRCDAAKPGCGACKRSAAAHGEDPALVVCQYEDEDPTGGNTDGAPKPKKASAKIAALEEKIAELERLIETHNIRDAPPNDHPPTSEASSVSPIPMASVSPPVPPGSQEPVPTSQPTISTSSSTSGAVAPVVPESSDASDPLLEVFYPGWPGSLPHPNIVSHMTNVFLTRCRRTVGSGQIDRASFRTALSRPPTSAGFPHLGLVHAMMAVAYREWGGDELALQLNRGRKYWGDVEEGGERPGRGLEKRREKDVADYHATFATRAVEDSLAKGFHLFEMSQATNILCGYFYLSAKFVEVWVYCGLATRIATPLGLNHLENCSDYSTGAKLRPRSLMPPPRTLEEKYRRSMTFWLAFLNDRYASAAASWAHSLDERDISTLLPSRPGTTGATLDEVDHRTNPLSISNPDFFAVHPPDVDEFQVELKCTVLLGRITTWLQRAPAPIGAFLSRVPNPVQASVPDLRATPDFIKLDQNLSTLRLSTPRWMLDIVNPSTGSVDSSRVLIHMIPHTCTILLHEAFTTRRLGDPEHERCMSAARAIMAVTYQLLASSSDFRVLSCFTSFCWSIAGRAFVREMALQELWGNIAAVRAAAQEADALVLALETIGRTARLGLSGAAILKRSVTARTNLLPLETLDGGVAATSGASLPSMTIPALGEQGSGADMLGLGGMQDVFTDPSWAALMPRAPDGSIMAYDNFPSDSQLQELDAAFLESLVPPTEPSPAIALDATAFMTTSA